MLPQDSKPFFAADANVDLLRRFVQSLRSIESVSTAPQDLAPYLRQIIDLMIGNAAKFDEFCTANIEWIGSHFIGEVREFVEADPDKRANALSAIFASAYRFLCELEFTQPADPSFEVRRVKKFVEDHLDEFSATDKQQIIFANYTMPAQVAKRLINDPAIAEFRRFAETVDTAKKLREDWDAELVGRQQVLEGLKDNLKNITSAFNFVGLVNGFQKLAVAKVKERHVAFASLLVLGGLMLLPVVLQIGYVFQNVDVVERHRGVLIYTLPTVIALEVILLYFFRVVLGQFRSVKAQLLQLDLRIALCQFIQSYAEYATRIKSQDATALSKFESLVFSGLVSEGAGIPSTFDGAEQIANLIKSIRGAS